MARNIERFIKELADYINTYIVGSANTHIRECVISDIVTNRGHAIPLKVDMPEEVEKTIKNYTPTFYAEELMNEYPNSSTAAIAEMLNVRMNEHYPDILKMLDEQMKALNKTIDEYDSGEIIVTAQPVAQFPNMLSPDNPFIVKVLPELGIVMSMKGPMCTNPSDQNQVYYTPLKKGATDITEEDWEAAKRNTLDKGQFHCMMLKPENIEIEIPVAGEIMDATNYCDYFYLLNVDAIWKGIADTMKAEKIYIIPFNSYSARFVAYSEEIKANEALYKCCLSLIAAAKEDVKETGTLMPVFVVDCSTMEIRQVKEGDDYAY